MHARITTLSIIWARTHGHRKSRRPFVHARNRSPAVRATTATARTFQTTKKPILHSAQGPTDGYPNGACKPPTGTRAIISSESRVPKLPCGLLFYRSSLQRSITHTYQFRRLQLICWCWLQLLPMRVPSNSQNCLVGFSTNVA